MTKQEWDDLIKKHGEAKVKSAMLDAILLVESLVDPLDFENPDIMQEAFGEDEEEEK